MATTLVVGAKEPPAAGVAVRDGAPRCRADVAPGDGGIDGEPHALEAVIADVGDEVADAGGGEREGGRAAVVVAQHVAAAAAVEAAPGHLRHRVHLALVVEHCAGERAPVSSPSRPYNKFN